MDGKEAGETPVVLSGVVPGRYQIRVIKEGYDPFEVTEVLGVERKEVIATLKKTVRGGDLIVQTAPPGATIYLDGKLVGTSPYDGKGLSSGTYRIRVIKEGFETWERVENVEAGKRVEVIAQLKVKGADLEVRSEPPRATVYLDGKNMGETPVTLSGVRAGQYSIRVVKEGYHPYEERVELIGGDRKTVLASLKTRLGVLGVILKTSGASLYVNGQPVEVGPSNTVGKELSSGSYKVKVTKEGFETWEGEALVEAGKRVEVLPKLKEMDWSKKSCEAPVWNIGDKWTYKGATGKVWDTVVVDIKGNSFIVRPGERRDLDGYDMKTLNWNFLIKEGGEKTEYRGPFKSIFNFPIFVGKEWKYEAKSIPTGGSKEANFLNELKVERVEEVTVPAGTFKVYRIYYKQTHMPSTRDGWICLWYSPVVKMWIKREVEKTSYWAKTTWLQDTELISYHLK
jgi:hypothetical protein